MLEGENEMSLRQNLRTEKGGEEADGRTINLEENFTKKTGISEKIPSKKIGTALFHGLNVLGFLSVFYCRTQWLT